MSDPAIRAALDAARDATQDATCDPCLPFAGIAAAAVAALHRSLERQGLDMLWPGGIAATVEAEAVGG